MPKRRICYLSDIIYFFKFVSVEPLRQLWKIGQRWLRNLIISPVLLVNYFIIPVIFLWEPLFYLCCIAGMISLLLKIYLTILQVRIAMVGKYVGLTDSYLSVVKVGFSTLSITLILCWLLHSIVGKSSCRL